MARIPKPWYRADRDAWFVTIRGERHNLGPNEKEATRLFHELMARPETAPTPPTVAGMSVAEVLDKYLDWCKAHRAGRTFDWYKDHIQSFINFLPEPSRMAVMELKPFHVVEWTDQHPSWGDNFRRGAIVAIQRPFNWAVKLGYIDATPIRHIEKPQATRREQVVTSDEWPAIRDHYADGDAFRDLLEFSWETGCRPQEVKTIEATHVHLDKRCVIFPPAQAKGKKRWRVIHMTPRAEAIIARRLALHAEGLLFLNAHGRPWTGFSMNCRFTRLKKHLGVKYAAYDLRHGFATRKLEDGMDHLTVAALMGHADGTMLARIYSHIGERQDHLNEQLNKQAT